MAYFNFNLLESNGGCWLPVETCRTASAVFSMLAHPSTNHYPALNSISRASSSSGRLYLAGEEEVRPASPSSRPIKEDIVGSATTATMESVSGHHLLSGGSAVLMKFPLSLRARVLVVHPSKYPAARSEEISGARESGKTRCCFIPPFSDELKRVSGGQDHAARRSPVCLLLDATREGGVGFT